MNQNDEKIVEAQEIEVSETEAKKKLNSLDSEHDEEPVLETEPKKKMFSKKNKDKETIEKLTLENQELKNQYFKAYADAENYKKRAQKELENSMKYRIQSFATQILPAIDNLERALNNDTTDQAFKEGVVMIYNQLLGALKEEGVSEIEALNKPFDHNVHNALMSEKIEGVEPNQVVEVLQKGYMLKDRILRAALVKVSE